MRSYCIHEFNNHEFEKKSYIANKIKFKIDKFEDFVSYIPFKH